MRARLTAAVATLAVLAGHAPAQPAQLAPEAIRRIKATTVYIRVKVPNGLAVGSGFLVKVTDKVGYVASNDHVIAPTTGKRKGEGVPLQVQGIQVVFNSGTADEWVAAAEVAARDPERDLGCLRFAVPKGKELPEPLAKDGAGVRASETMPVYVCGFPFGEQLAEGDKNPEISIGPASVSSVRSDDRGEVQRVQINGALNPGNSGGPVVDAAGKLVGVAVTTIVGAGLGFAVPQPMVKEMMAGRVSEPVLIRAGGQVHARCYVVDPLGKVKADKGVLKAWAAPVGDAGKRAVPAVSGLPGAQSFPLAVAAPVRGLVVAENQRLALPANVTELWVQSVWSDAEGSPRKCLAHRTEIKSVAAVGGPGFRPGGGGDDGGPGGLPREFFEGIPGLPALPGPRGPFGSPFGAAPNAPGGADAPASPFGGFPRGPFGPGGLAPRFGPKRGLTPDSPAPAVPPGGSPGGPPAATVEGSLALLDQIAADPARMTGRRFDLLLSVAGSVPAFDRAGFERLTALRPDKTPLAALRLDAPGDLVRHARPQFAAGLVYVRFQVERYDPAAGEAVGLVTTVISSGLPGGSGGVPAEEDAAPSRPTAPVAGPLPPMMTAPPDEPARPPVPAADDGLPTRVIVVAAGLMLAAVVGVVAVGGFVLYAGQQGKPKPKKRRPARDWDDEDEDYDDRPRRRRR